MVAAELSGHLFQSSSIVDLGQKETEKKEAGVDANRRFDAVRDCHFFL